MIELLENPQQLQSEREFARQTREKLHGVKATVTQSQMINMGNTSNNKSKNSAAPASGKYEGFGSDDINRLGFNNKSQFGTQQPYDPYTKGQSVPSQPSA